MLPLRLDMSGQLTVRSLAERVAAAYAADVAHLGLPLKDLAKAAGPLPPATAAVPGQLPPHPLCQAAFVMPMDSPEGQGPLDGFRRAAWASYWCSAAISLALDQTLRDGRLQL